MICCSSRSYWATLATVVSKLPAVKSAVVSLPLAMAGGRVWGLLAVQLWSLLCQL